MDKQLVLKNIDEDSDIKEKAKNYILWLEKSKNSVGRNYGKVTR